MGPTRARRRPRQQRRRTPSPERGRRTHNNINEHAITIQTIPTSTRAVPKNPFPLLLLLLPLVAGERLCEADLGQVGPHDRLADCEDAGANASVGRQ